MNELRFRSLPSALLIIILMGFWTVPFLGMARLVTVRCDAQACHIVEYSIGGPRRIRVERPITEKSPFLGAHASRLSAAGPHSLWWTEHELAGLIGLGLLVGVFWFASGPGLGRWVRFDRARGRVYVERQRFRGRVVEVEAPIEEVRAVVVVERQPGKNGHRSYELNLLMGPSSVRLFGAWGVSRRKATKLADRLEAMLGLSRGPRLHVS